MESLHIYDSDLKIGSGINTEIGGGIVMQNSELNSEKTNNTPKTKISQEELDKEILNTIFKGLLEEKIITEDMYFKAKTEIYKS